VTGWYSSSSVLAMGYTNEDVRVPEALPFGGIAKSAERRVVALTVDESTQQAGVGKAPEN
jgi:hypothetical protein